MMTSRRIQRHKNYAGLLEQHKKTQRTRSIVRWVLYVLMFLIGMMMVYWAVEKTTSSKLKVEKQKTENTNKQGIP